MSRSGGSIEIYQGADLEWRWRRRAANGEVVADSGEGYVHRGDAFEMAVSLFPSVPILEVEVEVKTPRPDGADH